MKKGMKYISTNWYLASYLYSFNIQPQRFLIRNNNLFYVFKITPEVALYLKCFFRTIKILLICFMLETIYQKEQTILERFLSFLSVINKEKEVKLDVKEMFISVLNEEITTTTGKKIKAKEALIKKIVQQALAGDTQAMKIIFDHVDLEDLFKKEQEKVIQKKKWQNK